MLSELKVLFLNGSLIGREFILPIGKFCIGKKEECELSFDFNHQEFFVLMVEKLEVSLSENSNHIWVDGRKYLGKELEKGRVIDLDGLCFTVGFSHESLKPKNIPKRNRGAFASFLKYFFVFSFFVLLGIGFSVYYYRTTISSDVNLKKWVESIIPQQAKKQIKLNWMNDDTVKLSGVVSNQSLVNNLIRCLHNSPQTLHYINNIITQNEIAEDVEEILHLHGYSRVTIYSGKDPGVISVYGLFNYGQKWQQVSKLINSVPGLKTWTVNSNSSIYYNYFLKFLSAKDFTIYQKISIIFDKKVEIFGVLNIAERIKLKKILEEFRKKNQSFPVIIYQNISVNYCDILSSGINTIIKGLGRYYLILDNGNHLYTNEKVNDLDRVTNITAKSLTIKGPNAVYHIPLKVGG